MRARVQGVAQATQGGGRDGEVERDPQDQAASLQVGKANYISKDQFPDIQICVFLTCVQCSWLPKILLTTTPLTDGLKTPRSL